ncbi:MAG: SH3 domain-containing protein [Chloroflexota bacterium]
MVDEPEDKGPRYRMVMLITIAAIIVPALFLLSWLGDNGLNNLFRQFLGMDNSPRVTRTATPLATVVAIQSPSATATITAARTGTAAATAAVKATETLAVPTATPTSKPAQAPATPTRAAVATATPVPPKPAATNTPRPAVTPTPAGLGWGSATPAYGGAAVIRAKPSSDSEGLGSIPLGERVFVHRQVQGEAIDPVESRWWEVTYQGVRGYVYYKLIKLD